jgi:hypothetical protein
MSACTLLNGEEQWADGTTHLHESDENKPEKGNEETNAYDTEEEEEDLEAADLPIIHLINRSDSVKAICLKYNLESRLFERINQFSEFTEEIYTKRKFVVIPSTRTFTHYLFEAEQGKILVDRIFRVGKELLFVVW